MAEVMKGLIEELIKLPICGLMILLFCAVRSETQGRSGNHSY